VNRPKMKLELDGKNIICVCVSVGFYDNSVFKWVMTVMSIFNLRYIILYYTQNLLKNWTMLYSCIDMHKHNILGRHYVYTI